MSSLTQKYLAGSFLALLALGGCASVHTVDPESPSASLARQGDQIAARGDSAVAMGYYKEALEKDPQNSQALVALSGLEEKLGDHVAAEAHARQAVQGNPHDAASQRALGRSLIALDRFSEAKEPYQAALDLDAGDVKALNGLAAAYDHLGDHALAEKTFRQALRLAPQDQATLNNLAYSLMAYGQPDQAIALLAPVVAAGNTTPYLRQNLAFAYALAGDKARAEQLARQDLSGPALRERLTAFDKMRKAALHPSGPFAEMGPYPTMGMAQAALERAKQESGSTDLKMDVVPVMTSPVGTPHFVIRLTGGAPSVLKAACDHLGAAGMTCRVH